jgi:hypothetical protein
MEIPFCERVLLVFIFNSFRVGEDFVVCHRFHLWLFILKPFGLRHAENVMTEKNMSINPTIDL